MLAQSGQGGGDRCHQVGDIGRAVTSEVGHCDVADLVAPVAAALPTLSRHRLVTVALTGLRNALAESPVRLSSMGRGLDADPGYFLAAAAAGRHAAALLDQ